MGLLTITNDATKAAQLREDDAALIISDDPQTAVNFLSYGDVVLIAPKSTRIGDLGDHEVRYI